MSTGPLLLGIDPGFSKFGVAAVELGATDRLLWAMTLTTEASPKKRAVLASDDNVRRARELTCGLQKLVALHKPEALCVESQSWPRNAGSSAKVGIAWGVIVAVAVAYSVPIVQASPQQVKKALTGKRNASKEEVQRGVEAYFGGLIDWPTRKEDVEHAADAAAAVIACMPSETIQMARRMPPRAKATP